MPVGWHSVKKREQVNFMSKVLQFEFRVPLKRRDRFVKADEAAWSAS